MDKIDREQLQARTIDQKQVGIDAKGRAHYFDPVLGMIWVTVDQEIAHVEETELEQWIDFVSDRVGWREQYYDDRDLVEHILATLGKPD